jgi:hypothetical protein
VLLNPNPPQLEEGVYGKRRLCPFAVYLGDNGGVSRNLIDNTLKVAYISTNKPEW